MDGFNEEPAMFVNLWVDHVAPPSIELFKIYLAIARGIVLPDYV